MVSTTRKRRREKVRGIYEKRTKFENEPSTSWFNLPFEMREMVIDEMDPKTRCLFSQCSKICENEAKKSRNYIYGIYFFEIDNRAFLCFKFDAENHGCPDYGYEFRRNGSRSTIITYKTCVIDAESKNNRELLEDIKRPDGYFIEFGKEKWTKKEAGKMENVVLKYLKDTLETYKNAIKSFSFNNKNTSIHSFNVKNLRRLEFLYVDCMEKQDLIKVGFINIEQVLRIHKIHASYTNLTFDQIRNFKGYMACVACDECDPKTIKKYFEMWKKGEINDNVGGIFIRTPHNNNLNEDYYTENLNIGQLNKKLTIELFALLKNNNVSESASFFRYPSKKHLGIAQCYVISNSFCIFVI